MFSNSLFFSCVYFLQLDKSILPNLLSIVLYQVKVNHKVSQSRLGVQADWAWNIFLPKYPCQI